MMFYFQPAAVDCCSQIQKNFEQTIKTCYPMTGLDMTIPSALTNSRTLSSLWSIVTMAVSGTAWTYKINNSIQI